MYGLADAAHPPRAEASSTTAAAAAADLQHHSVTDAAKLLLGNLWRADDVYFEAVKADDGRYNVSFVSPAVERLLGVPPEAALAAWRGCADALSGGVHSQDASRVDGHARSGLHGWHPVEFRLRVPGSSGDYVDVEATFVVKGDVISGVVRGVGAEIQMETALKELLVSSSFELRTSALNVQAASELLMTRNSVSGDKEAAFLANAAYTSCKQLLGIISNIIEARHLEHNELRVVKEVFTISKAVRDILQTCTLGRQLGPSSADVVWNHEDEQSAALPALVEGDLAHVSQIIQNLVTNAIKARDATPALMAMFGVGRQVKVNVHLDASLDVDQPLERVLRVDVIDQGVGIKEEDLERIFDPYVQLAPVNGGGTGLGLHIARSFACALGGGISVASAIGLGSTFTMTVPLHVLSDAEAAQPRPPPVTVVVPSETVPGLMDGGAVGGRRRSSSSQRAEQPPSPADFVCEPVASPRTPADDEAAMRVLADVIGNARDVFVFALEGKEPGAALSLRRCRIVFASPSVSNILGWKPEELVGRSCECLMADEAGNALNVVEERQGEPSPPASGGPPARPRPTRTTRQLAASDGTDCQQFREGDRFVLVMRDASRHKLTQSAVRDYLMSTSHDMRTPAHGIMTAAQLLASQLGVIADTEASFLVTAMRCACDLLISKISNVMDLRDAVDAQLAFLRMELRPTVFCPAELIRKVVDTCCLGCGTPTSVVSWPDAGVSLPPLVEADSERLNRILVNMMKDALVHASAELPLLLTTTTTPSSSHPAASSPSSLAHVELHLRISIADPGWNLVSEDDVERLFRPLTVIHTPHGTFSGLGLCVARALAAALGGSLNAARAHAPLRLNMADVTISPPPPAAAGPGAEGAGDSGEASAASPRPPPSGAVMTLRLPVVVRSGGPSDDAGASSPTQSSARLASVSASHAAAATAAAVASRAADKLAKERQVEEESGVRRTPTSAAEPPPPQLMTQQSASAPPPAAPSVLLIEDHPLNQKLMRKLLEKDGWAVDVAADGVQGLAMLQAALAPHPPGGGGPSPPRRPDLVLCDLQMPNMNGYEMTRAFRDWCSATQPPGFHLPVVAISADVMDEQVMKCDEAGFDGHLSKPLRHDMFQLLRSHITPAA